MEGLLLLAKTRLIAIVLFFTGVILWGEPVQFVDVKDQGPGRAIYHLAELRYVVGTGEGYFEPDLPLTRAQAAVFMLQAKHGPDYEPPPAADGDPWWLPWVRQAMAEGLMEFKGGKAEWPATRADVAQIMYWMGRAPE